jgi:hypothetical protein
VRGNREIQQSAVNYRGGPVQGYAYFTMVLVPEFRGRRDHRIVRNRAFFFAACELLAHRTDNGLNLKVPTLRMRRGEFSELVPRPTVRDPLTGQPFADNVIP